MTARTGRRILAAAIVAVVALDIVALTVHSAPVAEAATIAALGIVAALGVGSVLAPDRRTRASAGGPSTAADRPFGVADLTRAHAALQVASALADEVRDGNVAARRAVAAALTEAADILRPAGDQ